MSSVDTQKQTEYYGKVTFPHRMYLNDTTKGYVENQNITETYYQFIKS